MHSFPVNYNVQSMGIDSDRCSSKEMLTTLTTYAQKYVVECGSKLSNLYNGSVRMLFI